jgi:hypothetical protein
MPAVAVSQQYIPADFENHWLVCPVCHRPTASTSIFCTHHTTVIAFSRKWWVTAALILSPLFADLLISLWPNYLLLFSMLWAGVLLYQVVTFRSVNGARKAVLLWSGASFLLIGTDAVFPTPNIITNVAACGYFVIFGALILRRAIKYVEYRYRGIDVAIAVSSSVVTLYSFSLEFSILLKVFGLRELWLTQFYREWFYWIWMIRGLCFLCLLIILVTRASNEISFAPGTLAPERRFGEYLISQAREWADFAFALGKTVGKLLWSSLKVAGRLAIGFALQDVLPPFVILLAAFDALYLSRGLLAYMTLEGSSAFLVGAETTAVILLVFAFGYLELIAHINGNREYPPLCRALRPYWLGAIVDGRMFFAYISYVIPLTSFSVWLTSRVGSHIGVRILFPGFGFYSCVFTGASVGVLLWGMSRARKSTGV